MTEHAIICVTFSTGPVKSIDAVIPLIESGLPEYYVPEYDLKSAVSVLRVTTDRKITMVYRSSAFADHDYMSGNDFLFRRITFKLRLGPMVVMPSILFFTTGNNSFLQLRFPSVVYDRISGASGRGFDAGIKKLIILISTRIARALGLDGFSANLGDEEFIDRTPEIETINQFVGYPDFWMKDPKRFMFAACREVMVAQTFEADFDDPPFHYLCGDFAVFDCFWPT